MLKVLRYALRKLTGSMPRLLPVGTPAPDFTVEDHHGRTVRRSDLAGKRFVLWFFPKADTPGCTRQGCAFRDRAGDFEALGVKVFGVSFDTPAENAAFARKHGFPFPLLCDVTRAMGLAYRAASSVSDPYPNRITYVVGPDGRIEQAIATRDPGAQADALLASLA